MKVSSEIMKMAKLDGFTLKYVKTLTPEICLAAVKQNGLALKFVEEQTPEICMAAVKQNGLALEYVKEQSLEICLEAMKQNRKAVECINVELISDVQFVQNVSNALDKICEYTGKNDEDPCANLRPTKSLGVRKPVKAWPSET